LICLPTREILRRERQIKIDKDLMAIDPSFTRFGIAVYSDDIIYIRRAGDRIGKKTFTNIFKKALQVSNEVIGNLKEIGVDPYVLMMEEPFSHANFSSGLHSLDAVALLRFFQTFPLARVYGVSSQWVGHIHESIQYKKSQSTKLAKEIMESCDFYDFDLPGRLCHDEAEALIMLFKLILVETESEELKDFLMRFSPNYDTPKCRLRLRREVDV